MSWKTVCYQNLWRVCLCTCLLGGRFNVHCKWSAWHGINHKSCALRENARICMKDVRIQPVPIHPPTVTFLFVHCKCSAWHGIINPAPYVRMYAYAWKTQEYNQSLSNPPSPPNCYLLLCSSPAFSVCALIFIIFFHLTGLINRYSCVWL